MLIARNKVVLIDYTLTESGPVQISVLDVSGRMVARIVNGWGNAGTHSVEWAPRGLPSGVGRVRACVDARRPGFEQACELYRPGSRTAESICPARFARSLVITGCSRCRRPICSSSWASRPSQPTRSVLAS